MTQKLNLITNMTFPTSAARASASWDVFCLLILLINQIMITIQRVCNLLLQYLLLLLLLHALIR